MLVWLGFLAAGFARLLVRIMGAGGKLIPRNSGEFGDHNVVKMPEKQVSVKFSKKGSSFICLLLLLRPCVWELSYFLPVASRKNLVSKIVAFTPALDFPASRDYRS